MRYFSGANTATKLLFALAVSLLLTPVADVSAQQTGSQVEVMVCPQPGSSSFVITTPESDSTVSESKVVIEGDVEYISQLDFFVDDTYDHTIALGYAATAFRSSVTLSPGTHTIRVEATDMCAQTTHVDSAVVTYLPKTPPSIGSNVPTDIPAFNGSTPAVAKEVANRPWWQQVSGSFSVPFVGRTDDNHDPSPVVGLVPPFTVDQGVAVSGQTVEDCARAAVAVIGVGLIFAQSLVQLAAAHMSKFIAGHGGNMVVAVFHHPQIRWAGRGFGLVLLALAFLL